MRALRSACLISLWAALCSVAAAGAGLQGVVTAVRGNVVELSLGSKDGVKKGMVFIIKNRSGWAARAQVAEVRATRSTARIVQKKGIVAVGDAIEIERKGTMTVETHPLTPDEEVFPDDPHLSLSRVNLGKVASTPPTEELREIVAPPPPAPINTPDASPAQKPEGIPVPQRIARVESAIVLVEVTTPNALYWTTGVVVSQDGYVVTCGEYIALNSTVHVYVLNDKRYPAKVADKRGSLALLKLAVLLPGVAVVDVQPMSRLEPGTRAMALGYHLPPLMVVRGLSFKATTAWGTFGDLHSPPLDSPPSQGGLGGGILEADMEPDVGFLGAPVFRMDTGQLAGLITSIRTHSEDDARQAGVLTLHRTLTLLTPTDVVREFLQFNKVRLGAREEIPVLPDDDTYKPPLPGDTLNLRLLPPNRELPPLFHQRYRLGLGTSYREDIVADACYRFLGRVPSAVSEPLFDRERLFFGSINGRFYAFDPLRGEAETFWANEGVAFLYAPDANHEIVCATAGAVNLSPRARNNFLRSLAAMAARVVTANVIAPQVREVVPNISDVGLLYAWDRATGEVKWVYRTRFLGPPKIVGKRVYFAGLGVLGALDVATGQEVWALPHDKKKDKDKDLTWYHLAHVDEHNLFVTAIPVELCMEEQYQVCAAGTGSAQLQRLDPQTGKLQSQTKITSLNAASTALSASLIYYPADQTLWSLIGPKIITVDLNSGKVSEYKKELEINGKLSTPTGMACGNGMLYLTAEGNLLHAIDAASGADVWRQPFQSRGKIGAPAVVRNRIYVGSSDGYLYCLDAARGDVVWKAKTGGTLLAKPVVRDATIYCVSDEGDVHIIHVPPEIDYPPVARKPSAELKRSGLGWRK